MNRWRARLAELCNPQHPRGSVQVVQNVQTPSFKRSEHFEQRRAPVQPSTHRRTDVYEKRAAIIENDGGAPREWAEALARLDAGKPPSDVPPRRWIAFVDDCGRFLDQGWAERANTLGWGPLDLFGCDRIRPFARVDRMGLLWLMNGGTVIEVHRDQAIIETRTGARQTYRRRPVDLGQVALVWELAP
jgi:hypothetical protein